MSEWSSHLQFAGPRVFLVLLPFLIAFVYWVYQRTYPQVDAKRRIVLVVLRGAAVALLVMVLCEPVLTWWNQQVIRPLVLVLVDTSPSMRVAEGPSTRLQQATAVLGDEGWSVRLAAGRSPRLGICRVRASTCSRYGRGCKPLAVRQPI